MARHETIHSVRWSSRGRTKILAEVDVAEAVLAGGSSVGGSLSADSLRSDGDLEVVGAIDVSGLLVSSGTLRARSTLHCGEGSLRGRAHVDGAIRCDRALAVHGLLAAPSVQAGGLELDGLAEIPGLVAADRVNARFRGPGTLGNIRARSVILELRPANPLGRFFGTPPAVKVTRIEADTVELDGVDVQFVRAREISLGREAHVTEWEGHVVRRHASARLGPESRTPPPHGLSR